LRRIPPVLIEWLFRAHQQHSTTLAYDDYLSAILQLLSGLDQFNPASSILYLLYNAGLITATQGAHLSLLFVDDSAMLLTGCTLHDTHSAIRGIMSSPGGVLDWAMTHNCEFGIEKFQL
ncbi:hypothetical protein BDQ17DRAFT_1197685, partial [Cyathus striatus]